MSEPKSELQLMSKPEFVDLFLSMTKGWAKKDIAIMVWEFANGVWGDGYKQGKDDPEFEEGEE